jgi:hypothetical protein
MKTISSSSEKISSLSKKTQVPVIHADLSLMLEKIPVVSVIMTQEISKKFAL